MNVAEVIFATVASLLAISGATYMYGETSDGRSADRINAVLTETADNAAKVGPKVAEMSRADIQKLGIVPDSVLDGRASRSRQNDGEIAWKIWGAKTGKAGVELETAGVREGGKGYFRVYLEGVSSGVCARVFNDQIRESRWTALGVSNEAKISREAAETNPGLLKDMCAASSWDGRMFFEREIGNLAVVYLTPATGVIMGAEDDRTTKTGVQVTDPASTGLGRSWTRDTAAQASPEVIQRESGLSADIDRDAISQQVQDGLAEGQAVKEAATGPDASFPWTGENGGSETSVYGTANKVLVPGYNNTLNSYYSSDHLPYRNNFGEHNIIDWSGNDFNNVDATQITNIHFHSDGDNAYDNIGNLNNIESLFGNFKSSNVETIINESIDVEEGNRFIGGVVGVDGYPGGFNEGSNFNAEGNVYIKSKGDFVSVLGSGIKSGASVNGGTKITDDANVSAIGRVYADVTEASSDSKNTFQAEGGWADGGFGDGAWLDMLGEVHAAGGSGNENANAWGIHDVFLRYGKSIEEGAVLNGTAEVYLDGGDGNDSVNKCIGIGSIRAGFIDGGELYGKAEAWFDGGSGNDTFKSSCYGAEGFTRYTGTESREDTGMSGGVFSGELNARFAGGSGSDVFQGGKGILNVSPVKELSGGVAEGYAKCIADGGADSQDSLEGCSGIYAVAPKSFTGGTVIGTAENILSGGEGDDSLTGGRGISSVSVPSDSVPDGAKIEGYAANLLFGDQRIPLASLLNEITGSSLEEDDAVGISQLLFTLSPSKLAQLDAAMLSWELNTDGNDTLYGSGTLNTFSREQNFFAGSGGNDTMTGGNYSDTENLMFGGSGDDIIKGGRYGAKNIAYGGYGADKMTGGVDEGTVNEFYGGAGADEIIGGSGAGVKNSLHGDAGDDLIRGGWDGADNRIFGGAGHDFLYGGKCADNRIWAGNDGAMLYGSDTANGCSTLNVLYGGNGDDSLQAGAGAQHSYLFGGGGNDTLTGGTVLGSTPSLGDLLAGDGAGSLETALGEGFSAENNPQNMLDTLLGMDKSALKMLQGRLERWEKATDGSDLITGSSAGDVLVAGGGASNRLYGMKGDDVILGGSGQDIIFGGDEQGSAEGMDSIFAGSGEDIVWRSEEDKIDCGTNTDMLLNAASGDLPGAAGCEYGLSIYEKDGSNGPTVSMTSVTRIYNPFAPEAGSGNDILLGADSDDFKNSTGYAASLEIIDPELKDATKIEDMSTAAEIAEQLGLVVDDEGTIYVMNPAKWSPTDGGSWRNDEANLILHADNVRLIDQTTLAATCTDAEMGTELPKLYEYAGWDKLYGVGIALTQNKRALTLSPDWKIKNDGTGYVNCAKRLVVSNAEGASFYKWP